MSVKHTSEPWELDTAGWPLIINGPLSGDEVADENGAAVLATIDLPDGSNGEDEAAQRAVANGHLMKAAPRLLAALEALVPIGWNDGALPKVYAKEIEAAEAAIRLAKGARA